MAQDILIDIEGDADLQIENGDFVIGNSDDQHMVLLVNLNKGSLKRYPLACVGIILYSASAGQSKALQREILEQANDDGFMNTQVFLEGNETDTFNYNIAATRVD